MTVKELFEAEGIDKDFIEAKFDGGYWENCDKFIRENWDSDIEYLSPRQAKWASKILDDCVEEKLKR